MNSMAFAFFPKNKLFYWLVNSFHQQQQKIAFRNDRKVWWNVVPILPYQEILNKCISCDGCTVGYCMPKLSLLLASFKYFIKDFKKPKNTIAYHVQQKDSLLY